MPALPANSRKYAGHAAALAAMLAVLAPFTTSWEGEKTRPYFDRIAGVETVCVGETSPQFVDLHKTYTHAECQAQLKTRLTQFAQHVSQVAPGIDQSPYEWAALTDFAYNVGTGTFDRSSVLRLWNAGQRVEACRALRLYKYSRGKVITGLVYRREGHLQRIGEYELCIAGAVPAELQEGQS